MDEPPVAGLDEKLRDELDELGRGGRLKRFNVLRSPQGPLVELEGRGEVLVLSSNDYLGLANHPAVVEAGIEGLRRYGAGTASVRFICGLFEPQVELERDLAAFLNTESALAFVSCWTANQALLDTICDENTWVLSDELNHASIIDGIRLARPGGKAVYRHGDTEHLASLFGDVPSGARVLVVTDGVFSMEGDLAPLPELVELSDRHGATLVVDDSHGLGVMGAGGRGVAEHFGLEAHVDVITGTLGKALGGAAGGFVAGSASLCDVLEQRSRPQLFSNALPPTVSCSAAAALTELRSHPELVERLHANVARFRTGVSELGLEPLPGQSAIVPIIVGETARTIELSERLLEEGVFVTGFGYPVVPEGTARIRAQLSAALTPELVDRALGAFATVAGELNRA
jgi:glycine C-acetyltransferase